MRNESSVAILPCAFCGNIENLQLVCNDLSSQDPNFEDTFHVECKCGAQGPKADTPAKARQFWQNRWPPSQPVIDAGV